MTGLNWGDVATWVTGIATIALFIVGFLQIHNERQLRIKNEKQKQDRERRDQAEHISCWIVRENEAGVWVAILNQSTQPVYQVIVNVVIIGQLGEVGGYPAPAGQACIAVSPPGQRYAVLSADYHGMFRRAGVEIAFKDSAGRNWVRKSDGELIDIQESTVKHYDIPLPASWLELREAVTVDEVNNG